VDSLGILSAAEWVVRRSRHVRVDEAGVVAACAGIDPHTFRLPDWRIPVVPPWRDERLVDYILLFNSINFCYWAAAGCKWAVQHRGQVYDGAYGMMAALTRGLETPGAAFPLLEGQFLARISPAQFGELMRGNVAIPLEAERLAIWHAVGPVLAAEFDGHWHRLVELAGGSAVRLVRLLVDRMPSWTDVAQYDGRPIPFFKRAQLAAGMLYQAFAGQSWGAFSDFDELTVYADYKLPQVLRKLGILVYDSDLAALVDRHALLEAGSRMEVEVRAATVWAGELIRRQLEPRAANLTAAHVDFWLWEAGQSKAPDDRPYHRTLTTAY
jgi:hypothetical protein